MTTTKLRLAAIAAALMLGAGLAACSDDEDSSTDTTTEAAAGVPTPENRIWCTSVQNLITQSRNTSGTLSVSASLPELSGALTSLAANAPSEVTTDIQALAEISNAAVELSQTSPGSTLPDDARQEAVDAWDGMDAWVTENCGIEVPELTP
jgi:hypothetical protein